MKDLIVQLFSIMFPILIYQMFWEARGQITILPKRNKAMILIICSLSIFLCMTYPISIFEGLHYDLRDVPLIIGILYGGTGVGVLLTTFMFGYRAFLGGNGVYLTILSHAIVLPFVFYQIRKFSLYSYKRKMKVTTFFGFLLSITVMCISLIAIKLVPEISATKEIFIFFCYFVLSNTMGTMMTVFLIEKGRENAYIAYELQEAEKLRVVSQLAASIAHEVRNPLTVVRGFIQMLTKEKMSPDKVHTYGEIMLSELDRAQMIITDYLSYARPQSDPENQERIDMNSTINKSVNVMVPYALSRGVVFETQIEDSLYLLAEKIKIEQVLVNLLKNSIEAMPNGGTIHIKAEKQNKHILIEIIDEGMGMTEEQINQLGNPYFTTKEQGTGMGLMVCYRIIEALNGTIKVTSQVGTGTHFRMMVPTEIFKNEMA
jgi:two-component system, sporulation sensor kinase B